MQFIGFLLALTLSGVSAQYIMREERWDGSEYTYITPENTLRKTLVTYCPNGPRFRITQDGKLQESKTGQCYGLDKDRFLIRMDCSAVNTKFDAKKVDSSRRLIPITDEYACLWKKDGRYAFGNRGNPNQCGETISAYGSSSEFYLASSNTLTGTPGVYECPILSSSGDLIPSFDSSAQCFNTSQRAILDLTIEGKLQYLDKTGSPRCLNETTPNRVLKGIDCNQATTLFEKVKGRDLTLSPQATGTRFVTNPDYGLVSSDQSGAFSTIRLLYVAKKSDPFVFCQTRTQGLGN